MFGIDYCSIESMLLERRREVAIDEKTAYFS